MRSAIKSVSPSCCISPYSLSDPECGNHGSNHGFAVWPLPIRHQNPFSNMVRTSRMLRQVRKELLPFLASVLRYYLCFNKRAQSESKRVNNLRSCFTTIALLKSWSLLKPSLPSHLCLQSFYHFVQKFQYLLCYESTSTNSFASWAYHKDLEQSRKQTSYKLV